MAETKTSTSTDKPKVPKDGTDGYDRVEVENPYPDGTPAAWGHGGLNEGEKGSDKPAKG